MTTAIEPRTGRLSVHRGHIGTPAEYAHRTIAAIIRDAREPVLFTRVRLTGQESSTVAQANLDLTSHTLRIRAAAPNSWQAVDLLAERLRQRLDLPPAGER
jgi:ribosome-associated translation inhibitor RaiA